MRGIWGQFCFLKILKTMKTSALLCLYMLTATTASGIRSTVRVSTPICSDQKCCPELHQHAVKEDCESQVHHETKEASIECLEWDEKVRIGSLQYITLFFILAILTCTSIFHS